VTLYRRRLLLFAAVVAGFSAAALFAFWLGQQYPQGRDMEGFRWAAHRGVTLGWTHIYDPWTPAYGDLPITAWLYTPLLPLSYAAAYPLTLALSLAAVVGAWALAAPSRGLVRLAWLGALLAFLPLWNMLMEGQPSAVILLLLAFAVYSLRRQNSAAAGIALAAAVQLKPTLAFMCAPALLVSGEGRAFVWFVIGSAVAGAAYLLVLGPGFPAAFLHASGSYLHHPTGLAGPMFGSPVVGYAVRALVAAGALYAAWRRRDPVRAFGIGIVASLVISPYLELYDLVVVFAAAWTLEGWEVLAFLPGMVIAMVWYNSAPAVAGWEYVLLAALCLNPARRGNSSRQGWGKGLDKEVTPTDRLSVTASALRLLRLPRTFPSGPCGSLIGPVKGAQYPNFCSPPGYVGWALEKLWISRPVDAGI